MRRARSRRIQAQRKFAQGAYVPPNAVAVVAADNRRDAAQNARNVTINNMTATSLLDVVSLQSAASTTERSGLHSHLTSQPVVLLERLRGRKLARDAAPPSQTETNPSQHAKSTTKKTADPPKLQVERKKQECKRVHAMSLRSRRLSKLELNKALAQCCAPLRKTPSKRKRISSDEDEPLIFQKTRKKSPVAAAIESSFCEKSLKAKSSMDIDVPRKITAKEIKTNPISSKHIKENSAKKRKSSPQKKILKECSKKPAVAAIKKHLPSARDELINEAAVAKVVARNHAAVAVNSVDTVVVPDDPVVVPVKPKVVPHEPVLIPVKPVVVPVKPVVVSDTPVIVQDAPVVVPDAPVVGPDAPVVGPDAPVVGPDAPVVGSDAPVLIPDAPVAAPKAPVVFLYHQLPPGIQFVPFQSSEDESPEQSAAYLARLDKALAVLDDLPDLDNLSDIEDEPTVREDVHDEVPLNQRAIADQDRPTVNEEVTLNQRDKADQDTPPSSPDLPLVYHCDASDDEPMVRGDAAVKQVHRRTNDSPAPGPSGLQNQIRKNKLDTDKLSDNEIKTIVKKILGNATVNFKIKRKVQTLPKTCVAAAWRSEQDVINASKEQLDSRCKVCKPCQGIEKILRDNGSDPGILTEAPENEVKRPNSKTESSDMCNENRTVDGKKDDGYLRFGVPSENSNVTMKARTPVLYGKAILGVNCEQTGESSKQKEDLQIGGLQIIKENTRIIKDTLNYNENVNSEGPNKNTEGLNVNSEGPNVNSEGPNVNSEGPNVNFRCPNVTSKGPNVNSKGPNVNLEGPNINSEGPNVNLEIQNDNPVGRIKSVSSYSTGSSSNSNTEQEKMHRNISERKKIKHQKVVATRRRLADAKVKQAGIREENESETRLIEQKEENVTTILAEKKNCEVQITRLTERFEDLQKEKAKEIARIKVEIRDKLRAEMEADRRMFAEVDNMAQNLDNEKDAKSMHPRRQSADLHEPGTSGSVTEDATLGDAPVYFPTLEEFEDPVSFFEKIYPEAMKYGICKVVPPPGWNPPSEVHGDIRFDIMNQYISRLFNRWGPAARELSAIKLCLHQHTNINFSRPPQLDGVEINLPKLYHLVQRLGGLESVINKNRWGKVADDLKITKAGTYEKRLDNIYMKFLLAYDTLSHQERQEIMRKVEVSWNKKNQKLLDRAMNPLYRQQRMLGLLDSSDDEAEDENVKTALKQAEDCIIKGHVMQHSRFKKVASMTYENTFGPGSEAAAPPSLAHVEELYWRLVTSGTEHVCVHTAAIDTGSEGHGFTTSEEPYASHPWNPKQVIKNARNVLRYLGPVVGVTVPTLLLGMLFSTSCWHKDPHGVAWYEYQSKGPPRIWYGIPADQADNFRKAVETLSPTSCQNKALWLSSEIAMIPPSVLREHNVRLTRVTQKEGEFIMAFPNAYTSCISTGYTESESVYLASAQWIGFMWDAFKIARDSCEPTMFSLEQLLYNIARDMEAKQDLLKSSLPLYDLMVREEVTNRQMLQERGLSFVQQLLSAQGEQQSSTNNARPLEECDFCRASLFLSKVQGLPARNSMLCLEHTLALLDSNKLKDTDVRQLQVVVYVSVKELQKLNEDLRHRQRTKR